MVPDEIYYRGCRIDPNPHQVVTESGELDWDCNGTLVVTGDIADIDEPRTLSGTFESDNLAAESFVARAKSIIGKRR